MTIPLSSVLKFLIAAAVTAATVWFCAWQARLVGLTSIAFGVFVNLLLMGLFAALVGIFAPSINGSYFNTRPFESSDLYRKLGVKRYKILLKFVGSERMRRGSAPIRKDVIALSTFAQQTRISESSHTMAALAVLGATIYVALVYGVASTLWLVVSNIVFNVYPIILQRYNRPRVEQLIRELERVSLLS